MWKRTEQLPTEKFQVRYCKYILGVHQKATNMSVMGEVGRFPILITIVKSMLRYWQHIVEVEDQMPYLSAAFKEDRKLSCNKSWSGKLLKILDMLGHPLKSSLPDNVFINKVIDTMKSEYIKYWKNSLGNPNDNSGKLYLYRRIKGNFKIEPYLKQVNKNKFSLPT